MICTDDTYKPNIGDYKNNPHYFPTCFFQKSMRKIKKH